MHASRDETQLADQTCRSVAQSGSAPALGAGCRGFESLLSDQFRDYKKLVILHLANESRENPSALVAQLDRATAF